MKRGVHMWKDQRTSLIIAFVLILSFFWMQSIWVQSSQVAAIPYSEFETLLKSHGVDQLQISEKYIRGEFKEPRADKKKYFVTTRVDLALAKTLEGTGVNFSQTIENTFLRDILSCVLPTLIFFGIWMFLAREMAEKGGVPGLMSVGKSKAKLYVETDIRTTFEDVAGEDDRGEGNAASRGTAGVQGLRGVAVVLRKRLALDVGGQRGREPHPQPVEPLDHHVRPLPRGRVGLRGRGARRGRDARRVVRPPDARLGQHQRPAGAAPDERQPVPPDRAPHLPGPAEQPVRRDRAPGA